MVLDDLARLLVPAGVERRLDAQGQAGGARDDGEGRLFALPTYTAMLALRDLLTRRGAARSSWEGRTG